MRGRPRKYQTPGEARAAQHAQNAAWYAKHLEAGICPRCKGVKNGGRFWYCAPCRVELNAKAKARRASRAA